MGPGVPAQTSLDPDKTYRVVVAGSGEYTDKNKKKESWDALWCFAGACSGKQRFGITFVVGGSALPVDALPLTRHPLGYRASHSYQVEFTGRTGPFSVRSYIYDCCTGTGGYIVELSGKKACGSVATIVSIKGDLGVLEPRPGKDWQFAKEGRKLCLDDELHTGPDSEVVFKMEDGALVTVKELTEVRIRGFAKEESRIKTEIHRGPRPGYGQPASSSSPAAPASRQRTATNTGS